MIAALLAALLALDVAGPGVAPPDAEQLRVADYQIGGGFTPADDVTLVVRDRTDAPAVGAYSVCYVNVFQTQPGELDAWTRHHPDLLLRDDDGALVTDPGWPDEVLLDVRTPRQRVELAAVVDRWFAGCARDGFQAVEADNLDAWDRSRGLLTRDDLAATARLVTAAAHRHGLAIAQKNAAELLDDDLGFDLAVTEECGVYEECDAYTDRFGRAVVQVEYTDNGRAAFARTCAALASGAADGHPVTLRDRDVSTPADPGFVDEHC